MEKKRCNNFTSNEIDVLVSLVEEFKDIIECKKTDTVTNSGKEAELRKVETKFNSICGTGSTAKMLRSKWDSLKKAMKKEYAEQKQTLYKTGGGPAVNINMSDIGDRVLAIIGVGATGTISQFDSDFDLPNTEESTATTADVPKSSEAISVTENNISELLDLPNCSWKSWNPQQLRQPKSKALQSTSFTGESANTFETENVVMLPQADKPANTSLKYDTPNGSANSFKRKRFYRNESIPAKIKRERSEQVYEELARKKIELIDLQIKILNEETEKKEKRLAEKHELEIKILLAELQNKQKNSLN